VEDGENERFRIGVPYDFGSRPGETGEVCPEVVEVNEYLSFPRNTDGQARLKFSSESMDFFSEDGKVGMEASGRLRGIAVHDVLSKIIVPEDLDRALDESFREGNMDAEECAQTGRLLRTRIGEVERYGWFSAGVAAVYVERPVIDCDGTVYRPDRVVVSGGGVSIVDYKFGRARPEHEAQVAGYAELYRNMGFVDVAAFLWYVPESRVVKVV